MATQEWSVWVKVSTNLLGKSKTAEHRANISKALKRRTSNASYEGRRFPNRKPRETVAHKQVSCPHCGNIGGSNVMTRWHFDNCKHKK